MIHYLSLWVWLTSLRLFLGTSIVNWIPFFSGLYNIPLYGYTALVYLASFLVEKWTARFWEERSEVTTHVWESRLGAGKLHAGSMSGTWRWADRDLLVAEICIPLSCWEIKQTNRKWHQMDQQTSLLSPRKALEDSSFERCYNTFKRDERVTLHSEWLPEFVPWSISSCWLTVSGHPVQLLLHRSFSQWSIGTHAQQSGPNWQLPQWRNLKCNLITTLLSLSPRARPGDPRAPPLFLLGNLLGTWACLICHFPCHWTMTLSHVSLIRHETNDFPWA